MKLTVLGCAGTFPGPDSGCSSYLIEHDGFRLMLDCGYGAVGALQRHGGLLDLDAVVLSHLHADHCIDLVGYGYARHYHPRGMPPALPVYGPRGTAARIRAALGGGSLDWLDSVYDWRLLGAGSLEIGPYTLTAVRMAHPVECYGLRLEAGGACLAYSADTGPCAALTELARGADLFLCEASYHDGGDHPPALHLTGREAGLHATAAGVGTLLLTHLVSWDDRANGEAGTLAEAAAAFAGDVALARAGISYPVRPGQ